MGRLVTIQVAAGSGKPWIRRAMNNANQLVPQSGASKAAYDLHQRLPQKLVEAMTEQVLDVLWSGRSV